VLSVKTREPDLKVYLAPMRASPPPGMIKSPRLPGLMTTSRHGGDEKGRTGLVALEVHTIPPGGRGRHALGPRDGATRTTPNRSGTEAGEREGQRVTLQFTDRSDKQDTRPTARPVVTRVPATVGVKPGV